MTTEQKLAAVIEAQVKGGCDKFNHFAEICLVQGYGEKMDANGRIEVQGWETCYHILEILLDPEGLRAAYGSEFIEQEAGAIYRDGKMIDVTDVHGKAQHGPLWIVAASCILRAWLSGGAEKAIDAAYRLLP